MSKQNATKLQGMCHANNMSKSSNDSSNNSYNNSNNINSSSSSRTKSHESIPKTSAVVVVEKEKPVSCFSALIGVMKKHSGRKNRYPVQQSVGTSILVEIDSDGRMNEIFPDTESTHSSNEDTHQKNCESPIASDTTNEKNDAPRERGDFNSSLDTSLTRLHVRLEYLGKKKQLKTVIYGKGSYLSDELKKHDMYIEANMYLMRRKPNTKESYGTFEEKKMLDLGEEVLFKNVNSKSMRNSELHIHVRLTNGEFQSIPMGSVIIDCMDYCPGRENIFPIPMTRYC